MAELFTASFEGGAIPPNLSLVNATPKPYLGYKEYWKWGACGSNTTNEQAEALIALGSTKTEIWSSFRCRSLSQDYTTPDPCFEFGPISLTFTSATNLRLTHDVTDVDYTLPVTISGGMWQNIAIYANLEATSPSAIKVNYNGNNVGVFDINTTAGAISGSSSTVTIRGLKGTTSTVDDIRVTENGISGTPPGMIEGNKIIPHNLIRNDWEENGNPKNVGLNRDTLDLGYNTANGLFYGSDETGQIYTWDSNTNITTERSISAEPNTSRSILVHHPVLDRVYFLSNNDVKYMDSSFNIVSTSTTAYFDGTTNYAVGGTYNSQSGKVYLVSLSKTGTGGNDINVHIINKDGNVSVVSNSAPSAMNADTDRVLSVVSDYENDEILFPLYALSKLGKVDYLDAYTESITIEASSTVVQIHKSMSVWTDLGKFLVVAWVGSATSPTNNVCYEYDNTNSLAYRKGTFVATDTNLGGAYVRGVVIHPYLSVLFRGYPTNTFIYGVAFTGRDITAIESVFPDDNPRFTGNINPLTNGFFFRSNNLLYECRILSSGNVSNIVTKDSSFLQEGISNSFISPMFPVSETSKHLISANVVLENSFGTGNVEINGQSVNLSSTPTTITHPISVPSQPDILVDMSYSSTHDEINLGKQNIAGVTSDMVVNYDLVRQSYFIATSNLNGATYKSVMSFTETKTISGDFSMEMLVSSGNRPIYHNANENASVKVSILVNPSSDSTVTVGSTVITFSQTWETPVYLFVGRTSGIINVYCNELLVGSDTDNTSFDINRIENWSTYGTGALNKYGVYAYSMWFDEYVYNGTRKPSLYSPPIEIKKA